MNPFTLLDVEKYKQSVAALDTFKTPRGTLVSAFFNLISSKYNDEYTRHYFYNLSVLLGNSRFMNETLAMCYDVPEGTSDYIS